MREPLDNRGRAHYIFNRDDEQYEARQGSGGNDERSPGRAETADAGVHGRLRGHRAAGVLGEIVTAEIEAIALVERCRARLPTRDEDKTYHDLHIAWLCARALAGNAKAIYFLQEIERTGAQCP
jgi:hypothetical protein